MTPLVPARDLRDASFGHFLAGTGIPRLTASRMSQTSMTSIEAGVVAALEAQGGQLPFG